jgi:single-strand DNA-binding protein
LTPTRLAKKAKEGRGPAAAGRGTSVTRLKLREFCSIFVLMSQPFPLSETMTGAPPRWPRPPHCLTARQLVLPPAGVRVAIAGIVVCRQRPGTAKGVIFLTLEDETGVANVVVWAKIFERFRRAVIAGRCLKVTGKLQRDGDVVHVVAERIDDISALLDEIVEIERLPGARAYDAHAFGVSPPLARPS